MDDTGADRHRPILEIDLEEGERMASTLIDCAPEEARIGMAVELVIHEDDDGFKIPLFRPVSTGEGLAGSK